MRAEASAVRPLARGALDRATTTLARAFASDPMFVWMFPDPERRGRALQMPAPYRSGCRRVAR
jgi:hypothetical protein